jgi:hypothetical protein
VGLGYECGVAGGLCQSSTLPGLSPQAALSSATFTYTGAQQLI